MSIQITRNPATDWSPESARVVVTMPSGRTSEIDVYGPGHARLTRDNDNGGGINWAGIGTVSADDTAAFAGALLEAALLAPTLAPATETVRS